MNYEFIDIVSTVLRPDVIRVVRNNKRDNSRRVKFPAVIGELVGKYDCNSMKFGIGRGEDSGKFLLLFYHSDIPSIKITRDRKAKDYKSFHLAIDSFANLLQESMGFDEHEFNVYYRIMNSYNGTLHIRLYKTFSEYQSDCVKPVSRRGRKPKNISAIQNTLI